MRADRLTDAHAVHGEGPVWWPAWGGLRFVDMFAGDVLALDDATGAVGRTHVGELAAVVRPRTAGGAVVARRDDVVVLDADWAGPVVLTGFALAPDVRLNEGGCDPDGHFYVGSHSPADRPGTAALYRVDAAGGVRTEVSAVGVANGLGFSPDGHHAYFVDTAQRQIDIFDFSRTSGLVDRRAWVRFGPDDGAPDGLCVDGEGGVWIALYGGAQVRRYAADARLDAVVELPVHHVTACTFGGPDLDRLYVTTSALRPRTDDTGPAGAVYLAEPGVVGRPALTFHG